MRILCPPLFISILLLAGCTVSPPDGGSGSSSSSVTVCTMEAKLCPDGSSVGRIAPSCDFAACPGEQTSSSTASLKSVSDKIITFSYPSSFGLATTPEQVINVSYIPPCDPGFAYCLYYNASDYAGTNFESAGFSTTKRTDLLSKQACLTTNPDGYNNITPVIHNAEMYSTSLFAPLGDAAAGHYASDRLYRLFVATSCYEFRQRIGQTQFANFEPGTITKFTTSDERAMQAALDVLLGGITLTNNQRVIFPMLSASSS